MAFAAYINKNAQAAGRLLQGMGPDVFKAVLEKEVIGIAVDQDVLGPEGRATFDLVVRLISRLYPAVAFVGLHKEAADAIDKAKELAREINPLIAVEDQGRATRLIVIGSTRPPRRIKVPSIYVGSHGWLAKVSTKTPQGSKRSSNPFGAGAAACIAAANLFRACFSAQLPRAKHDVALQLSVLSLAKVAEAPKRNSWKSIDIGTVHLVGAGAIGNGFLWALAHTNCSGTLHVVDHDRVDLSNLQRYALTRFEDVDAIKAELSAKWLAHTPLIVVPHSMRWGEYAATSDWRFERLAAAVDTEAERIRIQAALPKVTFNAWTAGGELGVSRHKFLGKAACMACLYMPKKQTRNYDEILASALHLPNDRPTLANIRERLELNLPTDRAFLERIAEAAHIDIDQLLPFENKLLSEFYVQAICGGAVLGFGAEAGQQEADVPMAFQAALAGILQAADVIADAGRIPRKLPTITQIDLLTAVRDMLSRDKDKDPETRCICVDPDFQESYRAKYL